MAYTEKCRGCIYENACDYINCRTEETCSNCEYEDEDSEGIHCKHCIHAASENFKLKEDKLISKNDVVQEIWNVFNTNVIDSTRFDESETEAINRAFNLLQVNIEKL